MRFPNAVVTNTDGNLNFQLEDSQRQAVDCIVWAIGPKPNTPDLGAQATGF